jgi:biofilm PGA synthesis N-glycosyltransferase PgaC
VRISVMIAVYKEAELLGDIIKKLLECNFQDKEILVAVDGDVMPDIETALKPYQERITIFYNQARLGKVDSLNRLCSHATGNAFLFLDNDIELPEDTYFLDKLNDQLIEFDIVEMPKEAITKNWFSRIVGYDFLGAAITSLLTAKLFHKNLFLNGAAFAIRRNVFEELGGFPKVVNEDWELMLKAFGKGNRYAFPTELKVKNSVPTTITEWIEQRKRWALGACYWQKQIFDDIKRLFKGLPIILNILVLMLIPVIACSILWKFAFLDQIILLFSILLKQYLGVNLGALYFVSYLSVFLHGGFSVITALSISSMVFFIFSRILRFHFNILEYILYYLIYFPVLVSFYIFFGISVTVWQPNFDWKV